MDKSAIEEITALAHARETNELIGMAGLPCVAVPPGYGLRNLEEFSARPHHYRAAFRTEAPDDFIAYVNAHATEHTAVYVSRKRPVATAILDQGTPASPGWGYHQAVLVLSQTPAYSAVMRAANRAQTVPSFLDFVEDWAEHIVFTCNHEPVVLAAAVASLRTLTVSQVSKRTDETGDFHASRSEFDKIEFESAGAEPPGGFNFICEPMLGLGPVSVRCRLRYASNGKAGPDLVYRIVGEERLAEEMVARTQDLLQDGIKSATVRCGDMAYQQGEDGE